MIKKLLISLAATILLFSVIIPTMAGWGGKFTCGECGYESDNLHVSYGMMSSYTVVYCNKCKDFYSILTSFDEELIRKSYLKEAVPKELEYFRENLVTPIGEIYFHEFDKKIKIYPCPKCKSLAGDVNEKLIEDVCKIKTKEGKLAVNNFIVCPKCQKKTLYFEHNMKWD